MLTAAVKKKTNEVFDDKLLIFAEGQNLPFAYRAPSPETIPYSITEGRIIDKIGQFEISNADKYLICKYIGKPSGFAIVAPLSEESDLFEKEEIIIGYLRAVCSLELSVKDIERFEDLTARIAERCGCLTDIYREDIGTESYNIAPARTNSAFIALSLPIIALMYRRISALRGFNFKITFADGLPCLVFSAKVILQSQDSNIPEHSALCKIADNDGLSYIHRFSDLGEECEGGKLFKFSVAICAETVDPRGILRAPEWKKHTESVLSRIELDVPGRF